MIVLGLVFGTWFLVKALSGLGLLKPCSVMRVPPMRTTGIP